jgi:hypothetical protein
MNSASIHVDWRWPLSRVSSVLMVVSDQLAEGGGALSLYPPPPLGLRPDVTGASQGTEPAVIALRFSTF